MDNARKTNIESSNQFKIFREEKKTLKLRRSASSPLKVELGPDKSSRKTAHLEKHLTTNVIEMKTDLPAGTLGLQVGDA